MEKQILFLSYFGGDKIFKNREEAGARLALKLNKYKDKEGIIVLGLPRGGVIIGNEIANYLNCPLDVIIIRKLGFPGNSEIAIGAISEAGNIILDEDLISYYRISDEYIREEVSRQKSLIDKRVDLYRKGSSPIDLKGKTVILVDDGVATGSTMKVAISTLRVEEKKKVVVAIPVLPLETAEGLLKLADELIFLEMPYDFVSVGSYYQDFNQVTDNDVIKILKKK